MDNTGQNKVDLIDTSVIPREYQIIFPYPQFNSMQSLMFHRIMDTDTNVMLSAPTGCGKTVIAELAIVNSIMKNDVSLMLYVSPLRALCQEKVRTWTDRFGRCGVSVQEYTGDSNNQLPNSLHGNMLFCTTPEKFDLATRSWKRKTDIFSHISLVIIDEVHTLGDNRGAVLEAMVTRLLMISDNNKTIFGTKPIRIIALSATVPNYMDIAKWIRAEDPEKTTFNDSFRTTPIETHVFGYKTTSNDWQFESSLTNRVSTLIKQFSNDKPTLIFCCTRKSCEKTATKIALDMPSLPKVSNPQCHDKNLAALLQKGVGIHTAGLAQDDRELVEELFKTGAIKVICATSTLSQGINLPAALVIIKGTRQYSDGFLHEYDASQILQMMGRAGRPQFHDSGICIIMTESKKVKQYELIANSSRPVESALLSNLIEHVNAEIALGTIHSLDDALKWLKTTFFYIRVPQNPLYYHVHNLLGVERFLISNIQETIGKLEKWGFITIEDSLISITPVGTLCSKYGLNVGTMQKFTKVIINKSDSPVTMEEILNLLSEADEFNDIIVRQEDRHKMRIIAADQSNHYQTVPCDDPHFFTSQTKVFLIIQNALSQGKIDDWTLSQEFSKIKRISDRLLSALYNLFLENKMYSASKNTSTLKKCIEKQMWENESGRLAQQVKGIGEVYARKLSAAGYSSFNLLRNAQCHQLERITGHRPGWGIAISDNIARVPNYELTIYKEELPQSSSSQNQLQDMQKITLKIIVTNNSSLDPPIGHRGCELLVAYKDEIIQSYHIKTIAHMSSTFLVKIDNAQDIKEIEATIIDSEFIGIDITAKYGENKAYKNTALPPKIIPTSQKRVSAIPEPEEIVIWEMKPTINSQINKDIVSDVENESRIDPVFQPTNQSQDMKHRIPQSFLSDDESYDEELFENLEFEDD